MKLFLLTLALVNIPSIVYASVDFSKVVEGNAMLLLFLVSIVALIGGAIGKIIWDKMDTKLEEQTKKAEDKESEVWRSDLKLKEQEIQQIKVRVDRMEIEQNVCQRSLATNYVTRQEYDKFVTQHREEFANLVFKMEGMIKEFRNEIKTDMQDQIDRIVDVIGKLIIEKNKE